MSQHLERALNVNTEIAQILINWWEIQSRPNLQEIPRILASVSLLIQELLTTDASVESILFQIQDYLASFLNSDRTIIASAKARVPVVVDPDEIVASKADMRKGVIFHPLTQRLDTEIKKSHQVFYTHVKISEEVFLNCEWEAVFPQVGAKAVIEIRLTSKLRISPKNGEEGYHEVTIDLPMLVVPLPDNVFDIADHRREVNLEASKKQIKLNLPIYKG